MSDIKDSPSTQIFHCLYLQVPEATFENTGLVLLKKNKKILLQKAKRIPRHASDLERHRNLF